MIKQSIAVNHRHGFSVQLGTGKIARNIPLYPYNPLINKNINPSGKK